MICMEMFGSGVRTGMGDIHINILLILKGRHQVRAGFLKAVVGLTMPLNAAQRIVSGISRASKAAISVFV